MILSAEAPNRKDDDQTPSPSPSPSTSPLLEGSATGLGGIIRKTTELDELFLNLSSSLDHLFGLSMLIRRMRPKGRLRNLEHAPEDPRDVVTVMDKFPKLKHQTWLARRLGNAIGQRKQYFVYRQEHRQRLASRKQIDHEVSGDQMPGAETATTIATTFEEEGSEGVTGGNSTVMEPEFDRRSIFTSATSFVSDYDDNQEMGRRIPDLPDMVLDGAKLDYGLPIECPYCRTIQRFRNRLEWK